MGTFCGNLRDQREDSGKEKEKSHRSSEKTAIASEEERR